jgi:hypothetical protein
MNVVEFRRWQLKHVDGVKAPCMSDGEKGSSMMTWMDRRADRLDHPKQILQDDCSVGWTEFK